MVCGDLDQRSRPHHWVEKQKWVTKYVWSCRDQQAFHQDLHWFIHHWHPMVSRAFAELIPPAWWGASLLFNGHLSQAFLKQALTYRGAMVWEGKSCPNSGTGLDSSRPSPQYRSFIADLLSLYTSSHCGSQKIYHYNLEIWKTGVSLKQRLCTQK